MKALIINGSPVKNGATSKIVNIIADYLSATSDVKTICFGDLDIHFCKGCKACYKTAQCDQVDDVQKLINEMDIADAIVFVVPSYWADVPGQLKTFFDRCPPYCNTHEPHASLKQGKKCYAISLRTGSHSNECLHIIESINHYCGHMEIKFAGSFYLCGIKSHKDVAEYNDEIIEYCMKWFS